MYAHDSEANDVYAHAKDVHDARTILQSRKTRKLKKK